MAKLTDDEKEHARKNQEYWEKREKAQAAAYQLEESELEQRILARYNYLLTEIDARINDFYQRFAKAEGITMNLAEMAVSQMDVKAYSTRAAQLVKDRDFSPKANQELRLYNATMRINRLEMLKSRIGLELVDTYQQLEDEFGAAFRNRCTEEYERQAGILGQSTNVMSQKDIERILTADFNNANWSSRLWANQDALRDRLSEMLTNGIIQGRSVRVLAEDLEELLIDPSASNALRLMRTEMNRIQTETQMQSFRDNGYKQYMFISTEDSRTCSQCSHLNGQIFDVDDPEALKPPQHPNCRCSTAAYMDREAIEDELGIDPVENDEHDDIIELPDVSKCRYGTKEEYQALRKKHSKLIDKKTQAQIAKHTKDDGSPGGYVATHNYSNINSNLRNDGYKGNPLDADDLKTINAVREATNLCQMEGDRLLTRYVNADYLTHVFGLTNKAGETLGISDLNPSWRGAKLLTIDEARKSLEDKMGVVYTEKGIVSASYLKDKNIMSDKQVRITYYVVDGTHCYLPKNAKESEVVFADGIEIYWDSVHESLDGKLELFGIILERGLQQ